MIQKQSLVNHQRLFLSRYGFSPHLYHLQNALAVVRVAENVQRAAYKAGAGGVGIYADIFHRHKLHEVVAVEP